MEIPNSIQIAEITEVKSKAEIRRKILGTREIAVQSAKNPVIDNKEFFSSRKNFDQNLVAGERKPAFGKKFQTESLMKLLRGRHYTGHEECDERSIRI